MAGRIIGGRHVATARRSIRTAAVNIDDVEAVRNVGARVDEVTGMATVAARDPRGGRGKARVRQSPSSCTGGGHEVCEGVNAGDAGGHTAVAGRVERGLGTGERRGGSTAQRAVRASNLAGVNCGGGGGDHGVRGGGVQGCESRGGCGGQKARPATDTATSKANEMDDSELSDGVSREVDIDHTVPESPQAGVAQGAPTTPARTPPIMLQDVYISKLVAFSPNKEKWMKAKAYRPIGTAYIIGRVYCQVKKDKNASLFQIRWLDSQFHSAVEHISVGFVQLGIKNYLALTRVKNPDWRILVRPDPADVIVFEEEASDCEEEMLHAFDPTGLLPTSFAEVEAIKNMRFIPSGVTEGPSYLYQHENGSTQTYMRPEYRHLFEHSASSSFFAYIPLYFWRQVLHETYTYAVVNNIRVATPFTLEELMVFLGILFFMAMNDKGEYANYWGLQAEDLTFGGNTTSLDGIMTLHRFKLLRRCLSFNAVPNTLEKDGAARIWPLLNLLKITGGQYIHVGRNVALDEASVACRSRQGRHMIVYNPMKPAGKYHFRLYMVCCSTSWIALNYKLHCNRSDILDRLSGVVHPSEAQDLREELENVSKIRQHVLEVTSPLFETNRVVNMDNYYTSVQLLQELRLKGLFGRGTIRANSKHFPTHTILQKDDCSRGDYRQSVSHDHSMLAASWCDGNVVNLVSNADSTNVTSVARMVGSEKQFYPAPECVAQYNANMQGVDRLDQIRGRFSTADGHSFKRWHKKLALALIDVARSNAYLTWRLVKPDPATRDPHRSFLMELVDVEQVDTPSSRTPGKKSAVLAETTCASVSSRQIYAEKSRKRRRCIVCRWEGRYPTEVTNYCLTHGVCLCRVLHDQPAKPWMCPSTTSTCWDKFHQFYLPNGLFTDKGNVRRHSELAKLRNEHEPRTQKPRKVAARQIGYGLGGDGLSADHSIGLDAFGPNGSATHRLAIYSGPGGAGRGGAGTRGLGGAGVDGGATVELGGTGCGRAGARGLVDAAGVDGGAALGHNDAGRVGAGARGLCGAALGLGGAAVVGVTGRGGAAGRALGVASGLDGGSTLRLGDDGVNGGTARGLDGTGRGLSGVCGVGDTGVDGHSALELDGAGRVGPGAAVGLGGGAAGLGGGATRLCDVGRADAGVRGLSDTAGVAGAGRGNSRGLGDTACMAGCGAAGLGGACGVGSRVLRNAAHVPRGTEVGLDGAGRGETGARGRGEDTDERQV
ncbi:hypothetical protein F444_21512 [Phytophthora nicotianae P1976]|uniref:PiggyBac transposable element-derived protein domain-containing protein n=1 Tax=Phytophthora nicotianae P1976 TaxID=1317066 RepID=A0A080Z0V3_PHYNI|nr:hypothetical protein F444_21512 [Phytophthora nicotianae P1976]